MEVEAFEAAVRRHDAQIAALDMAIWVGSEPTFTDRLAQTPEWLSQALGGDKEARAQALLADLAARQPGSVVLRSVGRQYPGEPLPRWSLGLYRRRDGAPVWSGPPDPLLARDAVAAPLDLDVWATAMGARLEARGWSIRAWATEMDERRIMMTRGALPETVSGLDRPSVHMVPIPASGLCDTLAQAGVHLFLLKSQPLGEAVVARLELPAFAEVVDFLSVLEAAAEAAQDVRLPVLVLAGHPPPVDATVEWTTVTPDPAVIEINAAPDASASAFLQRSRCTYAAAAAQGLAPYRLYYNGLVADSGGGGQITLGGPSPEASPFIRHPRLLTRLVCYFNRHPALSYLFCHDYVGGSGQSARTDERGSDAVEELALTLHLLEHTPALTPELLWHSLAPFLCDAAGNSHRAEINIEKLWNPYLAGRGRLGLVEFRALRMQNSPERATALACLLRALVAMLARWQGPLALMDWGRELHQRFALPFYLEQDLEAVLQSLEQAGLGLDAPIREQLLRDEFRHWGRVALPGCTLEVRRALEFWPLLGDAASPEQGGGSRLVDASTTRIELRLRPSAGGAEWDVWQVEAAGVLLPMRLERDGRGPLKVFGLRYRSFAPAWGLHPMLGAQTPVRFLLHHREQAQAYAVSLHEWRPDGAAYEGLPADLSEAQRRRSERITVEALPRDALPAVRSLSTPGLDPFCLDLRYLSAETV